MKASFKTLSVVFFIPFMLLVCHLYFWAEEEASAQTKDIQIIDNPQTIVNAIYDGKLKGYTKRSPTL